MKSAVEMRKYADDCFDNQTQIANQWAKKTIEADIAPVVEQFAENGCYSCLMKFPVSDMDEFQSCALYAILTNLGYEVIFNHLLNSIEISW